MSIPKHILALLRRLYPVVAFPPNTPGECYPGGGTFRRVHFTDHGLIFEVDGHGEHKDDGVWRVWLVPPEGEPQEVCNHEWTNRGDGTWTDGPHWAYIETVFLPLLLDLRRAEQAERASDRARAVKAAKRAREKALLSWAQARGPFPAPDSPEPEPPIEECWEDLRPRLPSPLIRPRGGPTRYRSGSPGARAGASSSRGARPMLPARPSGRPPARAWSGPASPSLPGPCPRRPS